MYVDIENIRNSKIICALCIAIKDGLSIFIFGNLRIVKYTLIPKAIDNNINNGVCGIADWAGKNNFNTKEYPRIIKVVIENNSIANLNGALNNHVNNVGVFFIDFPPLYSVIVSQSDHQIK